MKRSLCGDVLPKPGPRQEQRPRVWEQATACTGPLATTWEHVQSRVLEPWYGYRRAAAPATLPPITSAGRGDDVDEASTRAMRHTIMHLQSVPCYAGLGVNPDSVLNTARYLFFQTRAAVFVAIRGGRVAVFQPFANVDYVNNWWPRLAFPGADGAVELTEAAGHATTHDTRLHAVNAAARRFAAYKAAVSGKRREDVLCVSRWWLNGGGVVCNVMPKDVWGDTFLMELRTMLDAACDVAIRGGHPIGDCALFLNKRDNPLLHQCVDDAVSPYHAATGGVPLPGDVYATYVPVGSFYTGAAMADFAMPVVEDWAAAVAHEAKVRDVGGAAPPCLPPPACPSVAQFRGSATGTQRLALWRRANTDAAAAPYLHVYITSWTQRDRVQPVPLPSLLSPPASNPSSNLTMVVTSPLISADAAASLTPLADWMSMEQQVATYGALVYVPGHCAASRKGTLLRSGRIMIEVACEAPDVAGHLWLDPDLTPVVVEDDCDDRGGVGEPVARVVHVNWKTHQVCAGSSDGGTTGSDGLTCTACGSVAHPPPSAPLRNEDEHAAANHTGTHLFVYADLRNLAATLKYAFAETPARQAFRTRMIANAASKAPTTLGIARYWAAVLRQLHVMQRDADVADGCGSDSDGGSSNGGTQPSVRAPWFSGADPRYAKIKTTCAISKDARFVSSTWTSCGV